MAGRPWSEDERKFVRTNYSDGMTIQSIAVKLSRSEVAVRHKLKEAGLIGKAVKTQKKFSPKEQQSIEDASYDFETSLLKAELKEMKQKVK